MKAHNIPMPEKRELMWWISAANNREILCCIIRDRKCGGEYHASFDCFPISTTSISQFGQGSLSRSTMFALPASLAAAVFHCSPLPTPTSALQGAGARHLFRRPSSLLICLLLLFSNIDHFIFRFCFGNKNHLTPAFLGNIFGCAGLSPVTITVLTFPSFNQRVLDSGLMISCTSITPLLFRFRNHQWSASIRKLFLFVLVFNRKIAAFRKFLSRTSGPCSWRKSIPDFLVSAVKRMNTGFPTLTAAGWTPLLRKIFPFRCGVTQWTKRRTTDKMFRCNIASRKNELLSGCQLLSFVFIKQGVSNVSPAVSTTFLTSRLHLA